MKLEKIMRGLGLGFLIAGSALYLLELFMGERSSMVVLICGLYVLAGGFSLAAWIMRKRNPDQSAQADECKSEPRAD